MFGVAVFLLVPWQVILGGSLIRAVLVALLVHLMPTIIGSFLPAIGIPA